MPFSQKKHKETKHHDVTPMILPVPESGGMDDVDEMNGIHDGEEEPGTATTTVTTSGSDHNVVLSECV